MPKEPPKIVNRLPGIKDGSKIIEKNSSRTMMGIERNESQDNKFQFDPQKYVEEMKN